MHDPGGKLAYGRPTRYAVACADGDWDSDPEPLQGWRRQHALASMRACLGVLSFVAFGVRHGEQLRNLTGNEPGARDREWDRANRWAEQVYRQCGIEWCPRCWSREVESTTVGYAPDSDRNKRTCRGCGHKWRPAV